MLKMNLPEPQRNRNATTNYVNLIMTSTVVKSQTGPSQNLEISLLASSTILLFKNTQNLNIQTNTDS